jgi:hypothetical protein
MPQSLIPAFVKFNFDKDELQILDTQLSLKFENGSGYHECMLNSGVKGYTLKKGTTVLQSGDVTVTIVKTPDGKQAETIKSLQESLKNAHKNINPKDYTKNVSVTVQNSGQETFLSLSFEGYVSELYSQSPELTNFPQYVAKVEIFDPTTIKLSS